MRNIPAPPQEEDFTADPAELFFDLSFVFAFSRLVFHLVHHPTWTGFAEFALLFSLIWMGWSAFTWTANAVAGNSRPVRVVFMIATAISLPMAVSLESPFAGGSFLFALTMSAILVMPLLTGLTIVQLDDSVRASNIRYLAITVAAVGFLIAGGLADGRAQVVLWLVALAILVLNTIQGGDGDWLVRPGHFAERHGLIVIVALGEVIVAIGAPVVETLAEGEVLGGSAIAAFTASGALAGMLWWSYFDRPLPALEHRHGHLSEAKQRSRFARDVFTYWHLPIIAGVLLAAAALEEIMLHPSDALHAEFRLMLFAGLALFMVGIIGSIVRAFSVLAIERVIAIAVFGVVIALAGSVAGIWLLITIDGLLLGMLVIEHYRVEIAQKMIPVPHS